MTRQTGWKWALLLAAGQVFASRGSTQIIHKRSDKPLQHQFQGTLGGHWIGMTLVLKGEQIQSGHYFYQTYLKDIPLTGEKEDSGVLLNEQGGGTFRLHFVGNGSQGQQELNFSNSIGLEGTWTSADGKRALPVSLRGDLILYGTYTGRRYEDVTDETDTAFERRVQAFFHAVMKGDRTTAVRYISYPLSVSIPDGSNKNFRTSAELFSEWDSVFTPAMLATLGTCLPHEMFVHDGMAMLGHGEAWFEKRASRHCACPTGLPVTLRSKQPALHWTPSR